MKNVVIIDAVRTAIGRRKGTLSTLRSDELLAHVLKAIAARTGIDKAKVEDVVAGCVTQLGEQAMDIARTASLMAGYPVETAGTTVNRLCGSSQQAFHFAAMSVESGTQEVVIAAGTESMTRVPMGADVSAGPSPFFPPSPELSSHYELVTQHQSAEMVAEKWGIDRKACEEFSLRSHQLAAAARSAGKFTGEIAPIPVPAQNGALFSEDEGIRPDSNLAKMATLEPVVKPGGVVTAATASQISDGAAAMLLTSEATAKQLGLKPRARVKAMAVVGVDPTLMLHGPIPATQKVLKAAGLSQKDIGLVEINEAFASVPLAWSKELGWPLERVNVNGGAIALGHPLGASGVRLLTTLLNEMERRDVQYGLSTMCIGFGQATATIIERVR